MKYSVFPLLFHARENFGYVYSKTNILFSNYRYSQVIRLRRIGSSGRRTLRILCNPCIFSERRGRRSLLLNCADIKNSQAGEHGSLLTVLQMISVVFTDNRKGCPYGFSDDFWGYIGKTAIICTDSILGKSLLIVFEGINQILRSNHNRSRTEPMLNFWSAFFTCFRRSPSFQHQGFCWFVILFPEQQSSTCNSRRLSCNSRRFYLHLKKNMLD